MCAQWQGAVVCALSMSSVRWKCAVSSLCWVCEVSSVLLGVCREECCDQQSMQNSIDRSVAIFLYDWVTLVTPAPLTETRLDLCSEECDRIVY